MALQQQCSRGAGPSQTSRTRLRASCIHRSPACSPNAGAQCIAVYAVPTIHCLRDQPDADSQPSSSGRCSACSSRTSRQHERWRLSALRGCAVVAGLGIGQQALLPYVGTAHAAEALSGSGIELFRQFLVRISCFCCRHKAPRCPLNCSWWLVQEQIDSLGPWGGALFVVTVMAAEMVPLFPTQPLSLASGLLFGPKKGAVLMLLGVTAAAFNAFLLARGVGRPLAERIIASEMKHDNSSSSSESSGGPLRSVTRAIEEGGFVRQLTAVTLLRLTPVVPYSASNYLLGLTPLPLGPYLLGTVAGMAVWSSLYASLGGASRALLRQGVDLEVLLADMVGQASRYTKDVAVLGVGVLVGAAALTAVRRLTAEAQPQQVTGPGSSSSSSSTDGGGGPGSGPHLPGAGRTPLADSKPSSPVMDSVEEALSRK